MKALNFFSHAFGLSLNYVTDSRMKEHFNKSGWKKMITIFVNYITTLFKELLCIWRYGSKKRFNARQFLVKSQNPRKLKFVAVVDRFSLFRVSLILQKLSLGSKNSRQVIRRLSFNNSGLTVLYNNFTWYFLEYEMNAYKELIISVCKGGRCTYIYKLETQMKSKASHSYSAQTLLWSWISIKFSNRMIGKET